MNKLLTCLILGMFLLSMTPTTSAATYSYEWNDSTKTATVYHNSNPVLDIRQVSVNSGLTTFEEVVEITSYVDYTLTSSDLKWLWNKHRGQYGIHLSELQRLTTESYVVTIQDYGDIEHSQVVPNVNDYVNVTDEWNANPWILDLGSIDGKEKWNISYYSVADETNISGTVGFDRYEIITSNPLKIKFFWNEYGIVDSHPETRYRDVFKDFSPVGKTIHSGQTYTIKTILHKKAEVGDVSIHLTPEIAGVTIKELTWWNSSWFYKIESVLTDVPSGGYVYNLTVHSASGTNNQTDVFLNGLNATNFTDIRFTLDDTTELAYWIENISICPIKVWVNVTDNGTVGLYYGNPSAASTSHGTNTFIHAFDQHSVWTEYDPNGHIVIDQTAQTVTLTSVNRNEVARVIGATSISGDFIIEWDAIYSDFIEFIGTGAGDKDEIGATIDNGVMGIVMHDGMLYVVRRTADVLDSGTSVGTLSLNTQYYMRLERVATTVNFYAYSDSARTSLVQSATVSGAPSGTLTWGFVWNSYGDATDSAGSGVLSKYRVRKYVSSEPLWSTWSVQMYSQIDVDSISQYNTQRKLTRTSEGYLHTVYTIFDGNNYRVYYAKSMDNGVNWVETVLTDAGVNNTHPSIAGDSEDILWVIYSREDSGIIYRKFEGLSWQTEQTISTDSGEVPVIAVDGSDSIHASWMANLSSTYQIRYWNETAITNVTSGGNGSKYPSLAIDSNNYLHLAYQKWNSTNNTIDIKYQKYTDSWQSVYNITLGETFDQTYPCIAVDLSDYVHVTWQTGNHTIQYKSYTTSWQATEEVCDGGSYEQYNPSVSVYATNYVYVTWFGKTAGYPTNWIIRERHNTGAWSAISDILHPAGKNVTYPNSISALYPKICGDCYLNIPLTGFSFVYDEDDGTLKYYNASMWRCEDEYVITITARDSGTNQYIMNFTVDFSAGETKTTDNGVVTYRCLESGYYEITISSNEFHSAQQSIVLDQSKGIIVYLTPISETVYVLPKTQEVCFFVQDMYGSPKENVNVNVTTLETTMGSWTWLADYFGFENTSTIRDAVISGSTDSSGSITFMMVETIKYNLHFVNATQGIDKTLTIYPKESFYLVIVGGAFDWFGWMGDEEPDIGGKINWIFTKNIIDDDNVWINITYNSTLLPGTNSVYFWINASNNTLNIHNETWGGSDFCTYNHTITNYSGNSYYVGFEADHTTKGTIREVKLLYFKEDSKEDRMLSIDGWKDSYYQWLSIVILFFTAACFSGVTIKTGVVVTPFVALGLRYVGWFDCSIVIIMTVVAIGITYFIKSKGDETKQGG